MKQIELMAKEIAAECSRSYRPSTWTREYSMQRIQDLIRLVREDERKKAKESA